MPFNPHDPVLAFGNRGEYYLAGESCTELAELVHDAGGELELAGDQCDDCGSFDPSTGEPGRGFLVTMPAELAGALDPRKRFDVRCGCCGRPRLLAWIPASETVFPY